MENLQSESTKRQSNASESKKSNLSKSNEVTIRVVDPINGDKRDFVLNQELLLSRMKFFDKYIDQYMSSKDYKKKTDQIESKYSVLEELDITVQGQIEVFKWLLK